MAKVKKSSQLKAAESSAKRKSGMKQKKETELNAAINADIAGPELLKKLVCNDEEIREKAFKQVSQLISAKRKFESFQLQKLWKGLWYTMWHSDTPLVQQALARDLAQFITDVADRNAESFIDAFWAITIREWSTLDRYRINKFYMLVRFVLNAEFQRLQYANWDEKLVSAFSNHIVDPVTGPLSYETAKTPHSLRLHLIDIYLDELSKVFEGKDLPDLDTLRVLLSPLLAQAEKSEFKHIKNRVTEDVLTDERLVEWKILEKKEETEPEEVDSEWEGFD